MNKLNKFSRAILAIAIMLCVALPTFAHDFEVNGIYYNYLDKTAKTVKVTYKGNYYSSYSNEYTGAVTIPSSVTYNSTTYSVTSISSEAFEDCSGLTSIIIPNSVTSIGTFAFSGCTGLTSITIPNSVTSIGSSAFYGCSNLETVINLSNLIFSKGSSGYGYIAYYACRVINDPNVSMVEDFVFSKVDNVNILGAYLGNATELILPTDFNGENYIIGDYAFYNCTGLTSVTIGNSVTSIGEYAFDGCPGLTEVNITDLSAWCKIDFGNYSANPLYYAKKLKLNGTEIKDLVIPNDITKIKAYAFYKCSGLTEVTIPNSVTTIGNYAFDKCSGLTSITIPNSVTSIGASAFFNCSGLTSVTIGNSVTSIGAYAFYYCTGLTELFIADGTASISGLSFPDSPIETLYLGRNTSDTFVKGKTTLKEVSIGNSVISIGSGAFEDCTGLTSVAIGNSVTSIGDWAFRDCSGLTSVAIGNSVTSIGDWAFFNCSGLTSITIPNSVTSIGDLAFYGCSNLETVINLSNLIFSKGSSGYGYIAYYACRVINDPNVSMVEDFVFSKVDNVNILGAYLGNATELILPTDFNGENYIIGDYAFYNCTGLTSITIPNSVISIGDSSFSGCSGLTSITIPNSVTSIGEAAFFECEGLTEVNISDLSAWCKIDFSDYSANPLYYAKKLKLNGSEITNLVIPNDITQIKQYAFFGCSGLTSVTIGNSVTSIGEYAFDCNNLRIVKSLSNTPLQCNDNAFGSNPAALLMVPKGSMMSYMIADGWRHFTKIQEFEVDDAVKPVLTIAYPEGGVIKQKVDNGTILELQIVPSNGWKCNSVTFNGVDVTNNLDVDGNYNTPSITADSQLSIVFVKDASGVESTLANDIKVCVNGNTVTILGADEFDDVEIYNTAGTTIYTGIEKSITLDSNGIYILTVEGETFKFAM